MTDEHREATRATHAGWGERRRRDALGQGCPLGTENVPVTSLQPGDVITLHGEIGVVIEVKDRPDDLAGDRPIALVVQPTTAQAQPVHYGCRKRACVPRYFDRVHYPVCNHCGGPMPCRELTLEWTIADSTDRTRRYEIPGVCPACEEPVHTRQLRQTWRDNLVVPNGQPVTFHLRKRCIQAAIKYDEQWRQAGHQSLLGFDPDKDAVERLLSELDGRGDDWGRSASARDGRRYSYLIPPKVNHRPRPCYLQLDGCQGKNTHSGMCNGLAMIGGCESCITKWVDDPEAVYGARAGRVRNEQVCASAHLHLDGDLSEAQIRAGLSSVKCGCRRGVLRIVQPQRQAGAA